MSNKTVEEFYTSKDKDSNYCNNYILEHSNRHKFIFDKFKLNQINDKEVAEFGVGLGLMFKLFQDNNQKNRYYGFDGAEIPIDKLVSKFSQIKCDLNDDLTNVNYFKDKFKELFDIVFCMETCEHIPNIFALLNNIKYFSKIGADIYITIPHESVTHPVIYHQLFYPAENFVDFLNCMALPVKEYALFTEGFASWIFKCENRPWSEKRMHFYKQEEKFRNANLVEVTNL